MQWLMSVAKGHDDELRFGQIRRVLGGCGTEEKAKEIFPSID